MNNFSKAKLLNNSSFYYELEDSTRMYFRVPTIEELIEDENIQKLVSIFNSTNKKFKNLYSLLISLSLNKSNPSIETLLKNICSDIKISGFEILYKNSTVPSDAIDFMAHVIKIGTGLKKFSEWKGQVEEVIEDLELEGLTEFEKRMKLAEQKIKKIKENTKVDNQPNGKKIEIPDIMAAVGWEYKYTLEQMFNMNYYTLLHFYSYCIKADAYRIESAILTSGLSSKKDAKHKYITDY